MVRKLTDTNDWMKDWHSLNRKLTRVFNSVYTITPKKDRPLCGARTRAGRPCRARAVWDKKADKPANGRCRMHGGLSTGPRTEEGKRRSLEALARGRENALRKRRQSGG